MSQTPQKRKWWEKPANAWKSCGALAVLVLGVLIALQWGENEKSDSIRNIIFALGGVGAFLGVWLASIRNMDFTRQVDEQTKQINLLAEQVEIQSKQTELQAQQTRSETLSRCVEQIGNKESATLRTAGIRGLEFLAQDHQDDGRFLQHLCDILQDFINEHAPSLLDENHNDIMRYLRARRWPFFYFLHNIKAKGFSGSGELTQDEKRIIELDTKWQKRKLEVEKSIYTFGQINSLISRNLLMSRRLDYFVSRDLPQLGLLARYLHGLSIPKREISNSNFSKADLYESFLPEARLWNIDLDEADLRGADLDGTHLVVTDLRKANLKDARMQATRFCKLTLREADFSGTKLARAVYYENEDDYKKDMENGLPQFGKPVTPEWLKEQGAKNWDKADFSEDFEY